MAEDTPETRRQTAPPAPPAPLVAPQQFSIDVLLEKYAKGDEKSADDVCKRVARGVAEAEPPERAKRSKRASSTTCSTARSAPAAS